MAQTYGPKYPGIKDGLVFSFDPKNRDCWGGGTTNIKDLVLGTTGTPSGFDKDEFAGAITSEGYLHMDGSDDYVIWNAPTTNYFYNKDRTITIWFNADTIPSGDAKGIATSTESNNAGPATPTWTLGVGSSTAVRFYQGNRWATIKSSLSTGTWYSVTNSYKHSTTSNKAYVNGVLEFSDSRTDQGQMDSQILIASDYFGKFDGKLGPGMIWDRQLSDGEVLANYNRLKGRFGL